jgi:hypothetical protein
VCDVVTLVLVALLHVPEARDAMHVGGLFGGKKRELEVFG